MKNGWIVVLLCAVFVVQMCALAAEDQSPWKFSVDARGSFNDNRDGLKNNREDNLEVILQPRATFYYTLEKSVLDFYYAPWLLWRSNPREDQNDVDLYHSVSAGMDQKLSPVVKFNLREVFDYTDDPKVTQEGTTIRENASYYMNRVNGGVECDVGPNGTFALDGRNSVKRYDEKPYSETADEDRWGGSVAFKYFVAPDTRLSVLGDFSDARSKSIRQNSFLQTYGLRLERTFTPRFSANLRAGYQTMDLPHAEKGSTDSGTADGEVVVSASRTQVRFSAGYSLAASDYDPYSYQERTRVSTTVEYDLTAKFSLRAMGLYENGDYDVDSVVEGQTGTGGSDALTDAQFGISYRINRNLTASLSYEYEDWNSDIRESFSRNWVTAAVRAEM